MTRKYGTSRNEYTLRRRRIATSLALGLFAVGGIAAAGLHSAGPHSGTVKVARVSDTSAWSATTAAEGPQDDGSMDGMPGMAGSKPKPVEYDAVGGTAPAPAPSASGPALQILGNTCDASKLPLHDGFQAGNKCVSTEFGEVGSTPNNPTLVISAAPRRVRAGHPFQIKVSTRNLVRDRFLAAAQGGYYKESSFLNAQDLQRGHFHTACRMLSSKTLAPDPTPGSVFFKATEDGKGSATPDIVTVDVPAGLPSTGTAECAAWAGDGSHRIPMMESVQAIPAFDTVRIRVTR